MASIINGSSPSITFSDSTTQSTSAVVSGKVPTSLMPTGSVIQVKQTVLNTAFATTSTSYTDITGLSVSITPTDSNNRILILVNVQGAGQDHSFFRLVRNSTAIGVGVPSGSQNASTLNNFYLDGNTNKSMSGGVTFIDSPATTSATTYKVQGFVQSGQLTVNGNGANSNNIYIATSISTITVMEISGT